MDGTVTVRSRNGHGNVSEMKDLLYGFDLDVGCEASFQLQLQKHQQKKQFLAEDIREAIENL